jgi:FkbM family methyltransferase
VANAIVSSIKRQVVRRFPDWVAAFHQSRLRRGMRALQPLPTPLGFSFAGPGGMQDGTFEPGETAFVAARLAESDVFVDIGANAGYFVCLARQTSKPVIAVEPAEQNVGLLFRNLRANGWTDVEVFPVGLAERPGLATLYGDGTGASLVGRWAGMSEAWQTTIPLSTLDTLLADRFAGARLLIKIDVEGAEHGVVAGARRTLQRTPAPVWLIEVCFTENFPPGMVNPRFGEIFDLFWSAGYHARSLEADRPVERQDVERWLRSGRRDFGYVSYIFEHDRCRV